MSTDSEMSSQPIEPASVAGEISTWLGMVVVNGPSDELKGGSAVIPLPGKLPAAVVPGFFNNVRLPFTSRVILTSAGVCETPDPSVFPGTTTSTALNPRPPGDTRSRGAVQNPTSPNVVADYLVPMMFTALSDPGSQNRMYYPAPNLGPYQ